MEFSAEFKHKQPGADVLGKMEITNIASLADYLNHLHKTIRT